MVSLREFNAEIEAIDARIKKAASAMRKAHLTFKDFEQALDKVVHEKGEIMRKYRDGLPDAKEE
jgi:hypothetical protein